jgi:hypothetical protein
MINEPMAVYRYGVGVWSVEEKFTRSLRTARTHALLMTYFQEQNEMQIAQIFASRIVSFAHRFSNELESGHLEYIVENPASSAVLIDSLILELGSKIKTVKHLKANQLENVGLKRMIIEVGKRLMKKVRGK